MLWWCQMGRCCSRESASWSRTSSLWLIPSSWSSSWPDSWPAGGIPTHSGRVGCSHPNCSWSAPTRPSGLYWTPHREGLSPKTVDNRTSTDYLESRVLKITRAHAAQISLRSLSAICNQQHTRKRKFVQLRCSQLNRREKRDRFNSLKLGLNYRVSNNNNNNKRLEWFIATFSFFFS